MADEDRYKEFEQYLASGEPVSYNDNLLRIALIDCPLDESEILLILIVYVLGNQATFVVENLRIVVHAILDC